MASTHYIISGLLNNGKSLKHIVNLLPETLYDDNSGSDRFSVREAIAHLADWEPILRSRIELCAKDSGGIMKAFDEGEMAISNHYSESDPVTTVEKFYQDRLITCQMLTTYTDDQWSGVALHPERGPMTAYEWTASLLGHDAYHIEDLLAILNRNSAKTFAEST